MQAITPASGRESERMPAHREADTDSWKIVEKGRLWNSVWLRTIGVLLSSCHCLTPPCLQVYTVPESATILLRCGREWPNLSASIHICPLSLSGGVNWEETTPTQALQFTENIVKTIVQVEQTFFDLAKEDKSNVLIICDRGAMDPSACALPSFSLPSLPSLHPLLSTSLSPSLSFGSHQ